MNPLVIPITTFTNINPANLTFLILLTTILINIFIYTQSTNNWFPLILTLLFSGGILILFSFFSSIFSENETPLSNLTPLWIISILIIFLLNNNTPSYLSNTTFLSSYTLEPINLLAISSFLLLFTLNINHQTINIGTALNSAN